MPEIIDETITRVRNIKDVEEILIEFKKILEKEQASREIPKGLIRLSKGSYYAVGDIHGDFNTLSKILMEEGLIDHVNKGGHIIFLGDYIDRGYRQIEVFITIALLKIYYKDRVIILRGNHEGPQHLLPYPHDYPYVLRFRYGVKGDDLYKISREIFDLMPYAAYREKSLIFLHGGVPVFSTLSCEEKDLKCILDADDPYSRVLEEILWNDPLRHDPEIEYEPSPRGAGFLWGIKVTKEFLRKIGVKGVVRGHEPAWSGYMFDHENKVLTLFSRTGDPYYNAYAAIARIGYIDDFVEFNENMIKLIH